MVVIIMTVADTAEPVTVLAPRQGLYCFYLEIRKLRHRALKSFAQSCTASKWWIWIQIQDCGFRGHTCGHCMTPSPSTMWTHFTLDFWVFISGGGSQDSNPSLTPKLMLLSTTEVNNSVYSFVSGKITDQVLTVSTLNIIQWTLFTRLKISSKEQPTPLR